MILNLLEAQLERTDVLFYALQQSGQAQLVLIHHPRMQPRRVMACIEAQRTAKSINPCSRPPALHSEQVRHIWFKVQEPDADARS